MKAVAKGPGFASSSWQPNFLALAFAIDALRNSVEDSVSVAVRRKDLEGRGWEKSHWFVTLKAFWEGGVERKPRNTNRMYQGR